MIQMSHGLFSPATTVVSCIGCAASLTPPRDGYRGTRSAVRCPSCGQSNQLPGSDVTADRERAEAAPGMHEAQRIEQLRAQLDKPMLPPPTLAARVPRAWLAPPEVPVAQAEWLKARRELEAVHGFPAEERLYFLTVALAQYLWDARQDAALRALLDSARAHFEDPRHRQVVHALLARGAARTGDASSAEEWLALCSPCSDDLHVDTAYRLARAYVSARAGDHRNVLEVLGRQAGDVPIRPDLESIATLLRLDALERTGDIDGAVAILKYVLSVPQQRGELERLLRLYPELQACPVSLLRAQRLVAERVRDAERRRLEWELAQARSRKLRPHAAVVFAWMAALALSVPYYLVVVRGLDLDPWLGAHDALICPLVCEGCSGPYSIAGERPYKPDGIGWESTWVFCQPPKGSEYDFIRPRQSANERYEVPGSTYFLWLSCIPLLFLLCLPGGFATEVVSVREARWRQPRLEARLAAMSEPASGSEKK